MREPPKKLKIFLTSAIQPQHYLVVSLITVLKIAPSSSPSCNATSTDLLDPLSAHVSIIHRSLEILKSISSIGTELLYIGSSWPSCLCSSMWMNPPEYITDKFVWWCLACLVRLTWIAFVVGCRWPYSCFCVRCFLLDLFNIVRSNLVKQPSSCVSIRLVTAHVVHPYSRIDSTVAGKKLNFILSVRPDFHRTDSLSLAVHAFSSRVWMSVSVDETLLPRYVNLFTRFRELPFRRCLWCSRYRRRKWTRRHEF